MIINEDLLLAHGATYEDYNPNDFIFAEGSSPKYFFQTISGTVELNSINMEGKSFTFNIFSERQSFGVSMLFGDNNYPMNAVAISQCTVLRLPKSEFFTILNDNPELMIGLIETLADDLYYSYLMLTNVSSTSPSLKIRMLIEYLKNQHADYKPFSYQVPLTRQQLANLTGMRVETIIRTVKKMEKERILKIENGKIFY
ncbi:hypothetical protein CHRYSEOSP005_24310 [Chryseobacterium sp. Alg-005]|uniref:Crp/Fnr family transcriptional regulator n=1 Tax=Chryseobacterium sp. Alg-005 TaxID=3159516 RepID=UPI00355569FB